MGRQVSPRHVQGAPEAACRAVCRAAIRLGETLELRKRAEIALDFFIQLTGASGAVLFLGLDGDRYARVAGKGVGLHDGRVRAVEHPGLAGGLHGLAEPRAVRDLPRRGDSPLRALRRDLHEMNAQWVIPLLAGPRALGFIGMGAEGPTESYDIGGSWILGELAALTASSLANAHAYEMAIFDEPTGLLAARYYHLRLREEMRRAIRHRAGLSLLLARLERPDEKVAGWPPEQLREASERIRELIRADLDIPARYSENEFAVLLPETGLEGARVLAGRIRESLVRKGGAGNGHLGVSIGIASYPEHADTVEELSDCAERALAQAATGEGIVALPATLRDTVDYRAMRKPAPSGGE